MLATLQNCIENPKAECLLFDTHRHNLFIQLAFPLLHTGYSVGVVSKDIIQALKLNVKSTPIDGVYSINHPVSAPSILCFSSGTKDMQKGIVRSLESWNESFKLIKNELVEYPKARAVVLGSLPYSLSLFGAMESLNRGAAPLIFPTNTLRNISRIPMSKDCVFWITPMHASFLINALNDNNIQPILVVKYVFVGGAHFSNHQRELLQDVFPEARIYSFYGTSETSFISIKKPNDNSESSGAVCEGVHVSILDENHQECAVNTVGTVWVNSNQAYDSYLQKSLKTNKLGKLISTNDKAFIDVHSKLYFKGRTERTVSVNGHVIDLYAIEKWFKTALQIEEIVLVSVPNIKKENELILCSKYPLLDLEWRTQRQHSVENFGVQGVPNKWVHCPNWPLLENGKVDIQKLKTLV